MRPGRRAQKNAIDTWVANYQQACAGSTINYQSVGSGAGIQSFTQGSISFAGSDSALKVPDEQNAANKRCSGGQAINLPMVAGPIAVAYNLSGVSGLILDAPTMADIFATKITKWNDPAIAALNPGVTLPSTAIQAFHRSDASGTTDNFTKYLAAAAPQQWTYATGKEWTAPGGQGAKGSEGVTSAIQQTDGAIGYVEFSYAKTANLGVTTVATGAPQPVPLTPRERGQRCGTGDGLGLGQQPSAQPELHLHDEGGKRLPDPPGHLRDHLLDGAAERPVGAGQELPRLHRQRRRAGHPLRPRLRAPAGVHPVAGPVRGPDDQLSQRLDRTTAVPPRWSTPPGRHRWVVPISCRAAVDALDDARRFGD